jgi:SAM-dependent methyltransferase
VNSCILVESAAAALAFPTGDLRLACCGVCGFIQNDRFEEARSAYSPAYEETQAFSPRFLRLVDEIVADQDRKYGLKSRIVLEIGCGKGDFLTRLVERTGAVGIGIDPAYRPERTALPPDGRLTFIQDFYGPAYGHLAADFVCCRHTLEHLPDVAGFLGLLRASIGDRPAVILFEVPDATRILEERAFWDIYYEHCNYFTPGALARAFRYQGFQVLDVYTVYDGQYLMVEARPLHPGEKLSQPLPGETTPAATMALVGDFERAIGEKLRELRVQLDGWVRASQRVVLWGSGSKAAGYLTTLGVGPEVQAVIDVNPHKAGKFQAGSGHPILAPSSLPEVAPDVVLVMNPIYKAEIGESLAAMGLAPALHALG